MTTFAIMTFHSGYMTEPGQEGDGQDVSVEVYDGRHSPFYASAMGVLAQAWRANPAALLAMAEGIADGTIHLVRDGPTEEDDGLQEVRDVFATATGEDDEGPNRTH